ncbi:hypothetical protein T05_6019 [Trichinella murrelli]|uniref:PiggyBac transposable element-derived protein domain-containing protein n=1 Tax=Trichinella murrelli TaxID=144512 RepID=A0A0V0TPB7_9BILA|nr:hypothetical protein T05_6019 [Trichinella murrelli]
MLAEVVKNVKLVLQAPMLGNWHSQFMNSNRNVWTHGLTSVGTISAYRRDVPACLRKAARRDPYSTLAKNNDDQLRAKDKNSNVLLLTSRHTKLKVDNQQYDKRPNIMNDYNLGKRGVDSMDARIEDFCFKK